MAKPAKDRPFRLEDHGEVLRVATQKPANLRTFRVNMEGMASDMQDRLHGDIADALYLLEGMIDLSFGLTGIEAAEAAEIAVDTLAEHLVTRNSKLRSNYRSTYTVGVLAAAGNIKAYYERRHGEFSPVPKNQADTLRLPLSLDDTLFGDGDTFRIARNTLSRMEVSEQFIRRAQDLVFNDFDGTDSQCYFELYRRWHLQDRPETLTVERTEFVRSLGYRSTGRTFQNIATRIRDQLQNWRTPTPYKVTAEGPNGGVVTADCFLPTLREYKAEKGKREKTVWVISDLDPMLFPRKAPAKFHRIPTRPFRLLTEELGNTGSADHAKAAVALILTEISFGRTTAFNMELKTLGLDANAFARHKAQREAAITSVESALDRSGIGFRVTGNHAEIVPNKGG